MCLQTFIGDQAGLGTNYTGGSWRFLGASENFDGNATLLTAISWERDLEIRNSNETVISPVCRLFFNKQEVSQRILTDFGQTSDNRSQI